MFSSPEKGYFSATYDITSGNAEEYFLKHISKNQHSIVESYFAILPNNMAFMSWHYVYSKARLMESSEGTAELVNLKNGNVIAGNTTSFGYASCLRDRNNVYSLKKISNYGEYIVKYDNSTGRWMEISERLTYDFYSMKDDCYYLMPRNRFVGPLYKISVKTGKMTKLDLTFNDELTEYETYVSPLNFHKRFFVIDERNIIFYDEYTEAFLLLTAN